MVGVLLNNRKDHEEIIRVWMDSIVKDDGIDRYDDLHLDQIDSSWKAREFWISAALQSFELAIGIRNDDKADLSVVLAFSLESDEFQKGLNFANPEELRKNFHVTPPSLYLFRHGTEFWKQAADHSSVEDVDWVPLFGANPYIKRCLYMEFKRSTSDEYTRSLFVAG